LSQHLFPLRLNRRWLLLGAMGAGKSLVTKLTRRETTDKILIWAAFSFFLLVVLYIVHKRLSPFVSWFKFW